MEPATVTKYWSKGILLDANILVIYLVGLLGREHLRNCRATKASSPEDFDLLTGFLSPFAKIITTPHILTETSNLAGRLPQGLHYEFRLHFRELFKQAEERYLPAQELVNKDDFLRFGLADTAIAELAPDRHLVLTDEVSLYNTLQSRGVDVINFNDLRSASWMTE